MDVWLASFEEWPVVRRLLVSLARHGGPPKGVIRFSSLTYCSCLSFFRRISMRTSCSASLKVHFRPFCIRSPLLRSSSICIFPASNFFYSFAGFVSTVSGSGISGYRVGASQQIYFNRARPTSLSGAYDHLPRLDGLPFFILHVQDGLREKAYMSLPSGVAVSSEGGVYVSDSGNHRIRYVSAVGKVSSVAGSGNAGFADGSLSRSKFNDPQAIVLTSDGNLFIADSKNHRIRLIDFEKGLVHTYAGAGIGDYRDAPDATQAYIRSPLGLAYQEQTRDLFFTDGDNRVRVVRALGGKRDAVKRCWKTGYVDAAGLARKSSTPQVI